MASTMSLVLSTTALWSFTAECSLLSPDLLRSDVLRPWLCGFRCITCRLSPKSPSLTIPHYPSPFPTVSRRLEDPEADPEARLRLSLAMVVASPPPKPSKSPDLCLCSWFIYIAFTVGCSSLFLLSKETGFKDPEALVSPTFVRSVPATGSLPSDTRAPLFWSLVLEAPSDTRAPFFQQLTGPQRVRHDFKPPSPPYPKHVPPCWKSIPLSIVVLAPRRSSRRCSMLLISGSSNMNLGFHCLDQNWVLWLLGQTGMGGLLGQKWWSFLSGFTIPTPSPLSCLYRSSRLIFLGLFRFKPSHPIKPRFLCSLVVRKVHSFSASVTIAAPFPQVLSCHSLSDSSNLGSYWMVVESVTLALWNSGIVLTPMFLDTLGSTFVLFGGILIALVRNITAICRFYPDLTLLEVILWQIGKRCLLSFSVPVILVHRGFHSPHLSFKEPIFLPNTSLVFSGIVIGSIVVKTILLEVEARIVVQDSFRSATADCLTMEVLFPPPCGFVKDYRFEDACFIDWPCLDSSSVELMSLPLSLSLYVSVVVGFSLSFVVFAVSALCRFVVSSSNGG